MAKIAQDKLSQFRLAPPRRNRLLSEGLVSGRREGRLGAGLYNRWRAEIPLPFRKKALYYGLMLFLTLLALEGMARLAYYAAYGSGYSGGAAATDTITPPPIPDRAQSRPGLINHPFYGHTRNRPYHALNAMPPLQRREDRAIIALLGGSVAEEVEPFLELALNRWFAERNLPRQPVVLGAAIGGQKQPQQTLIVANTLLLGGEFDLIINLDGRNEVVGSAQLGFWKDTFPFYPHWWRGQVRLTATELLLAGRIGALRREQARLMAAEETSPLRRSAVFGLANRWRQERIAAEIIQLNQELATAASAYNLEKHGPRNWREEGKLLREAAQGWYRGALTLARLAELGGAEYYHFLQPNQYALNSKPLSAEELEQHYRPEGFHGYFAGRGYALLTGLNPALHRQGINYFDLTGIFAAHPETLYRDKCCHLNGRGYELLAAEMVQRLEPALRRLGRESPAKPVSALAAARRPPVPDTLLVDAAFQVYIQGDGQWLRYVRADCAAADREARFFLHLTPRDLADLPPHRRGHSFDNRDFSFAEAGGRLWRGQCLAQVRLPDYPVAYLRTGQYVPYAAGVLWAGDYAFPE